MINLLQETKKKVEAKKSSLQISRFRQKINFCRSTLWETCRWSKSIRPCGKHFEIRGQHWPAGAGRWMWMFERTFFHASPWNNSRCLRKSLLRNGSWERVLLRGWKPNYLYEIFSIPWTYFRDRVLHLEPKEIAEKSLSKNFFSGKSFQISNLNLKVHFLITLQILFIPVLKVIKSWNWLNNFLHQNLIHDAGDRFNISAEQMFHGKNNLPPEWHVDKFGWMGNRFLFLRPRFRSAKLPKSAREILVWKLGGINLRKFFPARIYQL